jgi:hypothetical protein
MDAENLELRIAESLFGWRWLSYVGRPIRSTPDYPREQRVRRFFPPEAVLHKSWLKWFVENPTEPATGNEPLDYCYCSSNGPHMPTDFGSLEGCAEIEAELQRRGLEDRYVEHLEAITKGDKFSLLTATPKQRCKAALMAIQPKPEART